MSMIRKAALFYGIANLAIGAVALIGRFTTNNRKNLITRKPGRLFGMMANNWLHAVDHLGAGALNIAASRERGAARWSMLVNGIGYSLLALLGWIKVGRRRKIKPVLGFPTDRNANIFHTIWGALGVALGLIDTRSGMIEVRNGLREFARAPEGIPVTGAEEPRRF